jgi:hypothetical protein
MLAQRRKKAGLRICVNYESTSVDSEMNRSHGPTTCRLTLSHSPEMIYPPGARNRHS